MKTSSRFTLAEMLQAGIKHHQQGLLPQAVEMYSGVLQIDPDNAAALHLLGLIAHHYGRHEEALKLVRCAVTRRPNVAVFHNSHGVVLAALGRTREAVEEFQQALHFDPQCRDAQENLARMTLGAGRSSATTKANATTNTISERGYWLT